MQIWNLLEKVNWNKGHANKKWIIIDNASFHKFEHRCIISTFRADKGKILQSNTGYNAGYKEYYI